MKPRRKKVAEKKFNPWPGWNFSFWPFVIAFLLLWLWQAAMTQFLVRTIPYSEFKDHLARGEVIDCTVKETEILGNIRPKGGTNTTTGGGTNTTTSSEQPDN